MITWSKAEKAPWANTYKAYVDLIVLVITSDRAGIYVAYDESISGQLDFSSPFPNITMAKEWAIDRAIELFEDSLNKTQIIPISAWLKVTFRKKDLESTLRQLQGG